MRRSFDESDQPVIIFDQSAVGLHLVTKIKGCDWLNGTNKVLIVSGKTKKMAASSDYDKLVNFHLKMLLNLFYR